ncbi:MAG: hypothetical protein KatS3mg038_0619 [Candidatus Kapaibacterium sp.]|nr:MAG: hypothetical protein KatS3mg038_0619 [Candidatus Kapabacteria bacterium]
MSISWICCSLVSVIIFRPQCKIRVERPCRSSSAQYCVKRMPIGIRTPKEQETVPRSLYASLGGDCP